MMPGASVQLGTEPFSTFQNANKPINGVWLLGYKSFDSTCCLQPASPFGMARFERSLLNSNSPVGLAYCNDTGGACSQNAHCCSGFTCQSGICAKPPCVSGAKCKLPNLQGACSVGTLTCGTSGPVCTQVSFPSSEICDGLDNDCNGLTDEKYPEKGTTCSVTQASDCPGSEVPGKQACLAGKLKCQATHCDTSNPKATDCYCTIAGDAIGGQGAPCGVPAATRCIPGVDKCAPNSVCAGSSGNEECRLVTGCSAPSCWKPSDLNLTAGTCF